MKDDLGSVWGPTQRPQKKLEKKKKKKKKKKKLLNYIKKKIF